MLTSPLVSTQWLADHLGADALVILDASVHTTGTGFDTSWTSGRDRYERIGHVPGAVFADVRNDFSDPTSATPFARPSAGQFESAIAALGVGVDSTVVVYDDDESQWASRLWWLFRSFGFDQVAVLNGGLRKWQAEGRPTRAGALAAHPVAAASERFRAPQSRAVWADQDRVQRAASGIDPTVLVCAIDDTELGSNHPPIIPNSRVVPARRLLDAETNAFHKPTDLSAAFGPILDADEIITYCGVGSNACADALALTVLGHDRVRVYDGSLAEWWRAAEAG